jgi:hypothetical protein
MPDRFESDAGPATFGARLNSLLTIRNARGSLRPGLSDMVKGASLIARVHIDGPQQGIPIIGEDRQVVPHAGRHHVRQSLVRQMALGRMHDTDALIGGHALRLVHIDRIGEAKAGQHLVSVGQHHVHTLICAHLHTFTCDGDHIRRGRIEQAARLVIGRPTDTVSVMKAQGFPLGQRQMIAPVVGIDAVWAKPSPLAIGITEADDAFG